MSITKTSTENIPEDIWNVYQTLMEIAFEKEDVSKVPEFYSKAAFMIGTAEKELVIGHQALIDFYDTQQKSSAEVNLSYRRFPVKSWHPSKSTFCITDEYDMILDDEVAFRMRLTCVFIKEGKKWLCDHIHSSVPDRNVPEDEFWPIEELKRQNQILEQKVKERTRELEIEATLERVRARTMAMRHSDELAEASFLLDQEVRNLGIKTWGCAFNIYRKKDSIEWFGNEKGVLPTYTIPRKGIFKKYYDLGQKGSSIHVQEFKGLKCVEHYEYMSTLPIIGDVLRELKKTNGSFPEYQIDHVVYFKYGYLLFITIEQVPEAHDVFKRFAKVFEQTYTRFLDLQKAEAQAKEAQVEAALERVRSQAMAMQRSEDLGITIEIYFEQLKNLLGTKVVRSGAGLLNKENTIADITSASNNEDGRIYHMRGLIDMSGHPMTDKTYKHWQKQKEYKAVLKGNEIRNYYEYVTNQVAIPENSASDELHFCFPMFTEGSIYIVTKEALSDKDLAVFRRFSAVISLTYRRFSDLQKAETQAREAQIEVSLERVRSRSMAMHKSEEIGDVASVLFRELENLGGELWGTGFAFCKDKSKEDEFWFANENGIMPHLKIPNNVDPVHKQMYRGWKKKLELYSIAKGGKELKDHYKYMLTVPDVNPIFQGMLNNDISFPKWQKWHAAYFKYGYLLIITTEHYEEEQVFIRFAKAFEQAYTRFLDLQKAEAQAREAQIELALERIRAQATAMKESRDLQDIVVAMRREFVDLGHEAHYFWHMRWLPDRYEKAMTAGDGARIGMVMTLPRHIHGDIKLVDEWEKGKELTLVFPMDADTAVTYVDKMISLGDFTNLDPNAPSLEDVRQLGGLTFIMARTTHGEIGYSLPGNISDPPKEGIETLRRFAGAFDLAYRRFEDLKQAEQQAREAQIEAAVERVRSEAMAMHQPSDLVKVTQTLIKEITNLGIDGITGAAFILVDENDIVTMWDISDPGNMGYTRDHKSTYDPREFNMLGEFWRKWKKGEEYFVIEYDLEKNKKELEEWKLVDEENYQSLKRAIENQKLKTQWNPFGSFSSGLLTLDMLTMPDKDTEKIVIKMARTFDLAYQRFDDLQKAAQQAQQAKKQASLDRIRAEIASMRSQNDLEKLTPFIWMELSTLGISFFRCGIFIMDEHARKIHMYLSTPMGESIASMILDFDNSEITKTASEHWKKQEIFSEKWSKEEFVQWSEGLADQGLVESPGTYQHSPLPPDKLCLQFVPFKQGMLYIGTEDFLREQDLDLIHDVADTFSIAYSRYEDFVELEKAKHLAEDALGELRSTQSQLIHSEKMASLGELTAGIAHEIQNPLNFVNNFSDLNSELVDELLEAINAGDMDEAKEILNDLQANERKIIHHGKRAEDIVKGMLQHSRGGDGKKELTDINLLADEFLRLSYHGLRAKDKSFNADFKCTLEENLPKIMALSQDIGRVLLNLINNAFHATADRLKSTSNYKPKVEVITQKQGDKVQIIVKDNGAGIPDKIKEKIFQPFFTTKATGSGTGLGLSISHDIITKGHGGTIEITSKVGEGTTFTVNLPIQ